jgi:threonine/homoserine/homoserine lactone efflux protein
MVLFLAGIFLSLMGSLPPGLISLSVAHTAITKGFRIACILAVGAAFAEFFQAWLAVVLSDWFVAHPGVEKIFLWTALPVFIGLGIYLFFFAPMPKAPTELDTNNWIGPFGKGILISVFNLLAIPYWFAYCGWLKINGWWTQEGGLSTFVFSFGVTVGTLIALFLYAKLGATIVQQSDSLAKQANRIVAVIFWLIALKTLYNLIY